jgi:hypothetical protein
VISLPPPSSRTFPFLAFETPYGNFTLLFGHTSHYITLRLSLTPHMTRHDDTTSNGVTDYRLYHDSALSRH